MTPELYAALREPFPSDLIGSREGFDFVGHAAVTDRINKVDPAWTWEPLALFDNGTPAINMRFMGERQKKDGTSYEWHIASMWINLTICGVTRPAVGETEVYPWSDSTEKKLISDAIKNGAMRFGVALDLWSKEDLLAEPTATQAQIDQISDVLASIANDEQRQAAIAAWVAKFGKPDGLPADQFDEALQHARTAVAAVAS